MNSKLQTLDHSPIGITSYPTILELFGQRQLEAQFREGIRHLVAVLAQHYPEKFARIHASFDEYYLVFDLLIQLMFLKTKGGTFAECFYRIKRVTSTGGEIGRWHVMATIITQVLWPYVLNKWVVKDYSKNPQDWKQVLQKPLLTVSALQAMGNLVMNICYASGLTVHHDILMTAFRMNSVHDEDEPRGSPLLLILGTTGINLLFRYGSIALHLASILQEGMRESKHPIPCPPPPLKPKITTDLNKCELCNEQLVDPAVLATSGYVFCEKCIFTYVSENGICPITRYPTSTEFVYKLKIN